MSQAPLQLSLDRLDRVLHAIDLGCVSLARGDRPAVAAEMPLACWAAVRLGHDLLRHLAYDGLWSDLDLLSHTWRRITMQVGYARSQTLLAAGPAVAASSVAASVQALDEAARAVDTAQIEVLASRSRDRHAVARAGAAIDHLEHIADQMFVAALSEDLHGRLDAAMAVLTVVAARAARERTTVGLRRP